MRILSKEFFFERYQSSNDWEIVNNGNDVPLTKIIYENCESTEIDQMFTSDSLKHSTGTKFFLLKELFRPTSKVPSKTTSNIVNYLLTISGLQTNLIWPMFLAPFLPNS
jgi:hypothetical protein